MLKIIIYKYIIRFKPIFLNDCKQIKIKFTLQILWILYNRGRMLTMKSSSCICIGTKLLVLRWRRYRYRPGSSFFPLHNRVASTSRFSVTAIPNSLAGNVHLRRDSCSPIIPSRLCIRIIRMYYLRAYVTEPLRWEIKTY